MRASCTVGRVKERYLKYKNVGDELVGRTLTGIPPTSCNFRISPVYFKQTTENLKDIDEFASLVFPIEHFVLISLSHVLLATFIFYEEWTIQMIPQLASYHNLYILHSADIILIAFLLLKQAYHGKMILTIHL